MSEVKLAPSSVFRPNPKRAVFVQGKIDQSLIDRLTPQILLFQAESREPITVYIDSPGGVVQSADTLKRILQFSDQDWSAPCRLLTVVTALAASAAADLLSSGDFALAYPESLILFHGGRFSSDDAVTVERAHEFSERLTAANDRRAMNLASKAVERLMFRCTSMKGDIKTYRESNPAAAAEKSDVDCVLDLVDPKLTAHARRVLTSARRRAERYQALISDVRRHVDTYLGKMGRTLDDLSYAEFQAAIHKGVMDVQLEKHKDESNWSLIQGGFREAEHEFRLAFEYLTNYGSDEIDSVCERWSALFLSENDQREIDDLPEEQRQASKLERLKPTVRPVWLFVVALSKTLQEGENLISAEDAYWLGLIDEVIGTRLCEFRVLLETTIDISAE